MRKLLFAALSSSVFSLLTTKKFVEFDQVLIILSYHYSFSLFFFFEGYKFWAVKRRGRVKLILSLEKIFLVVLYMCGASSDTRCILSWIFNDINIHNPLYVRLGITRFLHFFSHCVELFLEVHRGFRPCTLPSLFMFKIKVIVAAYFGYCLMNEM